MTTMCERTKPEATGATMSTAGARASYGRWDVSPYKRPRPSTSILPPEYLESFIGCNRLKVGGWRVIASSWASSWASSSKQSDDSPSSGEAELSLTRATARVWRVSVWRLSAHGQTQRGTGTPCRREFPPRRATVRGRLTWRCQPTGHRLATTDTAFSSLTTRPLRPNASPEA